MDTKWKSVFDAMTSASLPYSETVRDVEESLRIYTKGNYVFPGAVLLVARGGEIEYHEAFGCRSLLPKITKLTKNMVFDIASLTKVLVPVTISMKMVDRGQLVLDKKLSHIFQTFGILGKERITIRHLLTHSSGFSDTKPYSRLIMNADRSDRVGIMSSRGATEMVYNEIFREKLENLPGKVTKYSDIGFILLGHALELLSGGVFLDRLSIKEVFEPLKLYSTGYINLSKLRREGLEIVKDDIVPTLACEWRQKVLCGEVHDENAWAMGGISSHAGVFSTAVDLHKFLYELIKCYNEKSDFIKPKTVKEFWTRDSTVKGSSWALGWDTKSEKGSSSGRLFSKDAVGHLGFTGCSVWVDPKREVEVILLSNRIHPSLGNERIKNFRPRIHDLVMEALGYLK